MTRRVSFSAGHRYWVSALSEAENRELFGRWASPYNHGHNYVLDVTVEGEIDPRTAMVVNIKRIDDILKGGLVAEFDNRSLNDEVAWFHERPTTLENLLGYIRQRLTEPGILPAEVRLVRLRLEEMPTLWAEWDEGKGMTLTRTYEFAASHRLHVPDLTREENLELFGKCNNPAGHGHNYVLEVTISGEPDPKTGMMVDLGDLDAAVNREVVDRYDHKNLNEDLPEFEGRATTSEIVAQEIFDRLQGKVPGRLARVRLWETARNAFDVEA
jgi:6-pyruvoyltetrahydropterin/6-carboxytetrahydropterin synthase